MIAARPSRSSGWSSTLKARIRAGSLIELARSRWVNHLHPPPEDAASQTTSRGGQRLGEDKQYYLERTVQSPSPLLHGSILSVSHQFFPFVRASPTSPSVHRELIVPRWRSRSRCRAPEASVDWPRIRVRLQFRSRRNDGMRLPALHGR